MTSTESLPEPMYVEVMIDGTWCAKTVYTASQLTDYAARVSAAKDAEIAQRAADWKECTAKNRELRAAAQQALEALQTIWACTLPDEETDAVENAANALTAALKGTTP